MMVIPSQEFQLPAIDGLHVSASRVFPLVVTSRDTKITAAKPSAPTAPGFATLYVEFETSAGDGEHIFVGGGGAWEGEGFVALLRATSREAVWVLYCGDSEPFKSAQLVEGTVVAKSAEYPFV
jgi:hypothetical protein